MDDEKKKNANTLEFIVTYIWAIMVIMAGLGILVYFGLITIEGSTCKIAPQIKCKELNVEPDRIFLSLENHMEQLLLGVDVGVEGCDEMDKGNILDKDTEHTFIITGCNNNEPGYKLNTKFNFTYTTENGNTYTKIGKIVKTVE